VHSIPVGEDAKLPNQMDNHASNTNPLSFRRRYSDPARFASDSKLDFLIAFVTSRCPYDCSFCLYAKQRAAALSDLSVAEWTQVAAGIGRIHNLVVSGGEPFVRRDLSQILRAFVANARVKVVDLPTNGFDPDIIYDRVSEICETLPEVDISLSVSIDGMPATHDRLRRTNGAFNRAVATLERVQTLKARFPALVVTAQSTICRANVSELVEFAEMLRRSAIADFHVFELVRGEIEDLSLLQIDAPLLRRTYEELFDIQCHYLFQEHPTISAAEWWARITDIGEIADLYSVQYDTFVQKSPWPFPCLAGRVSLVLESDGAVRACELRSKLGNVRDASYSVSRIISGLKGTGELADIACGGCYCTHVCSLLNSMERSLVRRMHEHPAAGMKAWLNYRSHEKCSFGN